MVEPYQPAPRHPSPIFDLPTDGLGRFLKLYGQLTHSYFQACERIEYPNLTYVAPQRLHALGNEIENEVTKFYSDYYDHEQVNEMLLSCLDSFKMVLREIQGTADLQQIIQGENETIKLLSKEKWEGDLLYIDETIGTALNELLEWAISPSRADYFKVAGALHSIPTTYTPSKINFRKWFLAFIEHGISPSKNTYLLSLKRQYRDYFSVVSEFRYAADHIFNSSSFRVIGERGMSKIVFSDMYTIEIATLLSDFGETRSDYEIEIGNLLMDFGEHILGQSN